MDLNQTNTEPTLPQVIKALIDAALIETHVCLPGKIESYDPSTQYASVVPSLMRKYESGFAFAWPVIPMVPVVWPRSNSGANYLHMPLVPGDDVLLVISERSLDLWKSSGGLIDPNDPRKFNISDAIAIPGCSGKPNAFTAHDPTKVELASGTSLIQMDNSGTIKVGKDASHGAALGDVTESRLHALEQKLASHITAFNTHLHLAQAPFSPTLVPTSPDGPFTPSGQTVVSETVKVTP